MEDKRHDATLANILVVDDQPANLLAMEAVLMPPKYNLTCASSGVDAVELVKKMDFALILLDVHMPGMDGYETARRIKALERGKDVPIIMITAVYREEPNILMGYAAGAIDYLGKPLNPDILKRKVEIYIDLFMRSRPIGQEKEAKAILEAMPVGVIVIDKTGMIYRSNDEANRIWGAASMLGLNYRDQYAGWWPRTGKSIRPDEWALARAIAEGEISRSEIINIRCLNGEKKIILSSAAPLIGNPEEISGAVHVMQDISPGKKAELELAIAFSAAKI